MKNRKALTEARQHGKKTAMQYKPRLFPASLRPELSDAWFAAFDLQVKIQANLVPDNRNQALLKTLPQVGFSTLLVSGT